MKTTIIIRAGAEMVSAAIEHDEDEWPLILKLASAINEKSDPWSTQPQVLLANSGAAMRYPIVPEWKPPTQGSDDSKPTDRLREAARLVRERAEAKATAVKGQSIGAMLSSNDALAAIGFVDIGIATTVADWLDDAADRRDATKSGISARSHAPLDIADTILGKA